MIGYVVSHAMGASSFLIDPGINGIIYRSGDVNDLTTKLRTLLDDPKACKAMGLRAYETIKNNYNGRLAGERLLNVSQRLLNGETIFYYSDGPMSRCAVLKNDWIGKL